MIIVIFSKHGPWEACLPYPTMCKLGPNDQIVHHRDQTPFFFQFQYELNHLVNITIHFSVYTFYQSYAFISQHWHLFFQYGNSMQQLVAYEWLLIFDIWAQVIEPIFNVAFFTQNTNFYYCQYKIRRRLRFYSFADETVTRKINVF